MKRVIVAPLGALVVMLGAGPADANSPSCAAQFVTQFAGPGFGSDVSAEARAEGGAFGAETKSFATAPHNSCPTTAG